MPVPNYFHHSRVGYGYIVAWKIDSYFYTKKSKQYLNDVVERFIQTVPNSKHIPYAPEIRKSGFTREGLNKLSDIAECLPNLKKQSKGSSAVDVLNSIQKELNKDLEDGKKHFIEDQLFEVSRWHIYRKAYRDGIDSITLEYVTMIIQNENDGFRSPREPSAVRQKSEAIYEFMRDKFVLYGYSTWTKNDQAKYMRDYREKNKGENQMTRIERALTNADAKAMKARQKVMKAMSSSKADSYKKKNGTWNFTAIARDLEMAINTVKKYGREYIKKFEEKGMMNPYGN